jgi:hypothetical protein
MIKIAKENIYTTIIFLIVTSFFLIQHSVLLSWDFSSYTLNSQYIFSNGDYYEVYRAPLAPILLAPTILFGPIAEYIFIIQTSIIFLVSCILFSDAIRERFSVLRSLEKEFIRFIFYILILTPFTIFYATQAGTELLALSFLILFASEIIKGRTSGYLLALGFLTRYNLIYFTPFLILNKKPKTILKNILSFLLLTIPWFLYNQTRFGNLFTSIVDSYALNIYLRKSLVETFNIFAPFNVMGITTVFVAIGLIFALHTLIKNKKLNAVTLIILFLIAITGLIIYDYASTPFKITRYLFNLTFPAAFFATLGIAFLTNSERKLKPVLFLILIFLFAFQTTALFSQTIKSQEISKPYYDAARDLKILGLANCSIQSPHWVPIRYLGGKVDPLEDTHFLKLISQNITILIFNDRPTYDHTFTSEYTQGFQKIYETNEYMFIGNPNITKETCAPPPIATKPLIKNHCEILSEKFAEFNLKPLAYKTCLFLNPDSNETKNQTLQSPVLFTPMPR